MRRATRSILTALLSAACIVPVACSAPSKGALILSISTDMRTPKDINIVSVFVTTDSVAKFDFLGRVTPQGTVALPSTLAIVEPDNPSAQVRIRVIAFQEQKARILRDVLTTVPHQRSALLRLPLNFLDDGSAIGMLPADKVPTGKMKRRLAVADGTTDFDPDTIGSKCDFGTGQTTINGECGDVNVDSSNLPDYTDSEVFGDGGTADNLDCFDVTTCYAAATPVTSFDTATCSFPLPQGADGATVNLAITTSDGTGDCVADGCIVPLEIDSGEGFSVNGSTVTVVQAVCDRLKPPSMEQLLIDTSGVCWQKSEADPVCEPTTGDDGGGSGDSASGDGPATVDAASEAAVDDAGAADATLADSGPLPDTGTSSCGVSPPDGSCNALVATTVVPPMLCSDASVAPTGTGGSITSGNYTLTNINAFSMGCFSLPPMAPTLSIEVCGSNWQLSGTFYDVDAGPTVVNGNYAVTLNGGALLFTPTCGPGVTGLPFNPQTYSFNGGMLAIFGIDAVSMYSTEYDFMLTGP